MFCRECGMKLPDEALFCPKCGIEIGNVNQSNRKINVDNNQVMFEVKPTFKFSYVILPELLSFLLYIISIVCLIFCVFYINDLVEQLTTMLNITLPNIIEIGFPFLILIVVIGVIKVISLLGSVFFEKKKFEGYVYIFYSDRVVFKDTFLDISEKEIKYKQIKEIAKKQTFMQRYFNIGNIILYSNAENRYDNGISMINIESVDDVYKNIKEIINV